MVPFRVYFLNAWDHIRAATDLECQSEDEAVAQAAKLAQTQPLELWLGGRRISRYPPGAPTAAA